MADFLELKIKQCLDAFTFVDCSRLSSRGIIKNLEVNIGHDIFHGYFHVMNIHVEWKTFLLLERAFMATVGTICDEDEQVVSDIC